MSSQAASAASDIKAAVDLSKQAADEDAKKQFASAYRIYRKTVEAYLNATLAVRAMCAPYLDRVLRLKEYARDDQEILCAGLPEMKCIHQLSLLGLLLPPWCLSAVTVSARRKICYTNDVVGIDPVKLKLSQILKNPKAKGASVILLYGPPGSGKSFLVRAITSKYPDKSVFIVSMASFIAATSAHEGAKLVSTLIRNFRKHDCGILVLEDIDSLYPSELPDSPGLEIDAVKKEVLAYMKELKEKREFRDVVVATARKPWRLEKNLLEMFQTKIAIPMPSFSERVTLITRELGKVRCPSFTESDVNELASRTERYSWYQIMSILRLALARNFEKLETVTLKEDAERVDHLTKDDILVVSDILRADVPESDLAKFREFAMGGAVAPSAGHSGHLGTGVTSAITLPSSSGGSGIDSRTYVSVQSPAPSVSDIRGYVSAQSPVPGIAADAIMDFPVGPRGKPAASASRVADTVNRS
ncbi:hypothetical protein V5799_011345 [Amblyomma americanum]|uniref:AAA+ ATPase domain-containing protein n=1 Tax=Amblyomma americanum TaxID=6943 RepID=A0AAQ4EHD3_AMBAM